MFVSRLLLPATLVLLPWLNACSWGQNYSAMEKAYGGAVPAARRQLSLSNQATGSPTFTDQQVNEYTAMSPNSWGQQATDRNLPQRRFPTPSGAAPNYSNTSSVFGGQTISSKQEIVINSSSEDSESEQKSVLILEQEPAFTPLTNTSDYRSESELSGNTGSDTPSFRNKSDEGHEGQPSLPASERYAQAQDFPFDGPSSSILKNESDSLFPFTRKETVSPVAPSEAVSPTSSPIALDAQDVLLPSTTNSELGMYPQPHNLSPATPSAPIQTQPYPQQFFPQEAPVSNERLPAVGFDYPNEQTSPAGQWQHPNGGASFQENEMVAPQGSGQHVPNWTSMVQPQQPTLQASQQVLPNFRPDLGHRAPMPTVRNRPIHDDGKKFDHEKKKVDYPPFKEIIATGKFFYNAEVNALRPSFLGNTGLSIDGAQFSESQPFEFGTTYAPQFKFGFESRYGPGVELSYFNLTENANTLSATNDGTGSVASIASVTGPGRFSRIGADNVGDTLTADHSFEMETIGLNFFKELKFPISRLNGKFGFMYANVAQSLLVEVNDAANASIGGLVNTTDFRGYGPQFALEYFRPVGHTPLTLVTSFGGKGLFGRRDQFVNNDAGIVERRFGADEFITVIDFAGGVQLKKMVADGRYWTAKVGYLHQTWLGGGTAVDPQGDFGINGFTFGVGYNR